MHLKRPRLRHRPLTRAERAGVGTALTFIGLVAVGVVAGVLLDRLIDFDDIIDAGGDWDEGGGVKTRWY